MEVHEQTSKKTAEWYDKEIEPKRKRVEERVLALFTSQERAVREQEGKLEARERRLEEALEAGVKAPTGGENNWRTKVREGSHRG
eukprot:507529-Amphidinium_carterae.2